MKPLDVEDMTMRELVNAIDNYRRYENVVDPLIVLDFVHEIARRLYLHAVCVKDI